MAGGLCRRVSTPPRAAKLHAAMLRMLRTLACSQQAQTYDGERPVWAAANASALPRFMRREQRLMRAST